ncbi:MAG: hypothetical protein HQL46_11365 [Gammaproteobacteria bacterium]|nr:hypothetical protein [Gammaproteobacteria bacterium]
MSQSIEQATEIKKLGLEALMSRAHIIFTSGYHFKGPIQAEQLEQSFIDIVECMTKFEYKINFTNQSQYHWEKHGPFKDRFLVIETQDIEQEFKEVCSRSVEILENSNHYPMVMVLIKHSSTEDFIIAQLSEHTPTDAGSSEVVFNKVIAYYNALTDGDTKEAESILEATKKIQTISTQDMVNLLQKPDFDHQKNIENLLAYPIADNGDHKISLTQIPKYLKAYKQRTRHPVIEYFDIAAMLKQCRQNHPEISRNSIISAVLAKALYLLNVEKKNTPQDHSISFRMLSNILPHDLRQLYSGNYIAFVPVTVDGQDTIEDMAVSIHQRIREFKQTQLDVTLFDLVEGATQDNAVGKEDDEVSFIVTNWNNYTYLNNKGFLNGCTSIKHISGVNLEPKDVLGASLVNRPVMAINLSPDEQLTLSFFPSLDSDEKSREIMDYVNQLLS